MLQFRAVPGCKYITPIPQLILRWNHSINLILSHSHVIETNGDIINFVCCFKGKHYLLLKENCKCIARHWNSKRIWNLTHWRRMTHLCVSKLNTISSDSGLFPGWRQAIIWTNGGILLISPLRTNFSEMLIEIPTFFNKKKLHLKISAEKWRPIFLGFDVLKQSEQRLLMAQWASPFANMALA